MGNFFTSTNFNVSAVLSTAGTVTESGALSRVLDYLHPSRRCVFNGAGTATYIAYDFGAAQSLHGVLLENFNAGSAIIRGNATDSWGAPSYAGTFVMTTNPWDKRTKGYLTLTSFNYRYMRLYCGTATTVDSTSQWAIGTALPVISGTLWPANMGNPFGYAPMEDVAGDPNEPVIVSPRYAQIFMTGSVMNSTQYAIMQDIVSQQGTARAFLFYRNRDDTNASERAEAYIMRRRSTAKIEFPRPSFASMAQTMFEEVR